MRALAEHHRVIRYDRPGSGLSDRDGPTPRSLSEEVAILGGLVAALDLDTATLFGGSSGSVVAAGCAAAMPSRVSRLVLYGGYASGRDIAGPAARAALVDVVRRHWGLGSRLLADLFMPDASADERAAFARFQRMVASPEQAAGELSAVYAHDVGDALPRLTMPTLVLHRRHDRAIPFALGRDLAARIAGARLVELPGAEHFPWHGDVDAVTRTAAAFLAGRGGVSAGTGTGIARTGTGTQPEPRSHRRARLPSRSASSRSCDSWPAGRTDAEIAEALVLSPHTVHRHVSNIRTKLGVPTRAAATAWLAHHDRH